MPSTTRATTLAAIALFAAAPLLSSCSDTASGEPSSSTTTSSTTSTTSSTTTPSTTTPPAPTDEEQAKDAVVAFYKELDLVAAGKAPLDSFRHATDDGEDPTGTLAKWQGLLSNQLLQKGVQVGTTKVYDLAVKPSKPVSDGGESKRDAWIVTACVDRSGIHLEDKSGKRFPSDGGQEKSLTTQVVLDVDGDFMVIRDDPGKSC
jgi:hypothetical protein